MKATLYDLKSNKKGEIPLPKQFEQRVRSDIVAKLFECEKFIQPYSSRLEAGKRHSASGKIRHRRHEWGGHYGKGISRVPRKTMWRRGTQFFWIGAEVASVRGGRRAHPPKGIGKEKKFNKKEIKIAFNSGFAATIDNKLILSRYESLNELKLNLPVVIENLEGVKSKEFFSFIKNTFGEAFNLAVKKKKIRAGIGSMRGRKYKSNAGLLLVIGKEEKIKLKGVDVKSIDEISISDLYPLGRLAVYTKRAIEELGVEK